MKKISLLLALVLSITLLSCKKKGVCTCKDGSTTNTTYYEDLTSAEKKTYKRTCNGDSDGKIVKTEYSNGGITITDSDSEDINLDGSCEWSRKGEKE
jgi:major membrane immunogen (membrane-anchored lipoprotein)